MIFVYSIQLFLKSHSEQQQYTSSVLQRNNEVRIIFRITCNCLTI